MSLVTVTEHGNTYSLLQPGHHPPRVGDTFQCLAEQIDIPHIIDSFNESYSLAVDLETCGTDPSLPDTYIVGVGLAWDTGSCYVNCAHILDQNYVHLINAICDHPNLIAHNVYFDGAFLFREGGRHPNWHVCTFGLYKQLASEGFPGQRWGLKEAMIDMLGWPEANDRELGDWLVSNGYTTANGKNPNKSEMWRAPPEILGKYCMLDVEATYLFYWEVLYPAYRKFEKLVDYHQDYFLTLDKLLIEQKFVGILMDIDKLKARQAELISTIDSLRVQFVIHPDIHPHILEYEQTKYNEFLEREPVKFLKERDPGQEPAKYKINGEISKNWIAWNKRCHSYSEAGISRNWEKWDQRRKAIFDKTLDDYMFNPRSGDQLRWLLYEKLGHDIVETTESGLPSIGEDALRMMGSVGKLLVDRVLAEKELSYVEDYLGRLLERDTLHPSFKVPGTYTGRLSGSKPNVQQIPKSRATMEAFIARPGHVWVDVDINALEMVVTTELTEDQGLLQIYHPDAPPNDIYLNDGARMPIVGDAIRATGYDPDYPTPESIAHAKKEAKASRNIVKTIVLASNYGAGPNKIHRTLRLNGVDLDIEEVREIHRGFWELHNDITRYKKQLELEWTKNRGYVMNGLGRPMAVWEGTTKDLLNRVVQSTGHDILMIYISILAELLNEHNIDWKPIIIDFHDEVIIEVPEHEAEEVKYLMEAEAFKILNDTLGGFIPLKGSAHIIRNLADAKLED